MKSKEELIDHLVVLLAGRAAEQAVFGAVTTGAADDLKRVHEISRAMVTDYGMGKALGSRRLPTDDYSMSDATRLRVDEAQEEIADLAERRAAMIVAERRTLLEKLAVTLLTNEILERPDIERIVGDELRAPSFEETLRKEGLAAEAQAGEPGPA